MVETVETVQLYRLQIWKSHLLTDWLTDLLTTWKQEMLAHLKMLESRTEDALVKLWRLETVGTVETVETVETEEEKSITDI